MILIDNKGITDPYINLALEEYLVRHADCAGKDHVLFYTNRPSVVIGKNQSIYRELNHEYLHNGQLELCRRITGGGAVYHDAGNLNFSFITQFADHKLNNYAYFNQPVVDALRKAGVDAWVDKRNNIMCNWKKLSGSAQFTDRKNIISHGTLLLNADLKRLSASLKLNRFKIETRAVGSIRSSVMNIAEVTAAFADVEQLKAYLITELKAAEVYNLSEDEWQQVLQLADEKFRTYQWVFARSPKTVIRKAKSIIEIEDGCVSGAEVQHQAFSPQCLKGIRYNYAEIKKALGDKPHAPEILAMIFN